MNKTKGELRTDNSQLVKALADCLEALEASLEADDPQACTQMEWEMPVLANARALLKRLVGDGDATPR
jgi:hypothetical protein